jgi:hypothetical protein
LPPNRYAVIAASEFRRKCGYDRVVPHANIIRPIQIRAIVRRQHAAGPDVEVVVEFETDEGVHRVDTVWIAILVVFQFCIESEAEPFGGLTVEIETGAFQKRPIPRVFRCTVRCTHARTDRERRSVAQRDGFTGKDRRPVH